MDIEELEIEPIDENWFENIDLNLKDEIREKEHLFGQMLKALIDVTVILDEHIEKQIHKPGKVIGLIAFKRHKDIIEKACYPKKWPEIKEISNNV